MGVDFVALMKYTTGLTDRILGAIERLEHGERFPELDAITKYAQEQRYLTLADIESSDWVSWHTGEPIIRPRLPDLSSALRLPQSFFLTFSFDAIRVYSLLRWYSFLTNEEWQRQMLSALRLFCHMFGAVDGVIMGDDHPADRSFFEGYSYDDCLRYNGRANGRKATIAELYCEVEDDSELAMMPSGKIVLHPRNKPLPRGWLRPTIWDSKGYWRLPLNQDG
jgi:hypothetical protein